MADTSFLSKYRYFQQGIRVDEHLIRSTLLPGLLEQASFSGAAPGIRLGESEPAEYLPLDEAATLIVDWLSDHSLLQGDHAADNLLKLARRGYFGELARALYIQFNDLSGQEKVAVATTDERLERYLAFLREAGEPAASPRFSAAEKIRQYHHTRQTIIDLIRQGYSKDYIASLSPTWLRTSMPDGSNHLHSASERALFLALADNLTRLHSAGLAARQDPELRSQSIAKELITLIQSDYPALTDFLVILRDPRTAHSLTHIIDQAVEGYGSSALADLETARLAAVTAQPDLIPSRVELSSELSRALQIGHIREHEALTQAIIREIVASSAQPLSTDRIVELALQRLKFNLDEASNITSILQSAGLDAGIEYRQGEMHVLLKGRRLSRAERRLIQEHGISFAHTHPDLASLQTEILRVLNLDPEQLPAKFDFDQHIQDAYLAEANSADPSSSRLTYLRALRNHYWKTAHLTKEQQKLISQTRFASLAPYEKVSYLTDKVFDFYSTATGQGLIARFYDWYEKLAEGEATLKIGGKTFRLNTIIELPLGKDRKLKIPFLNLVPWLYNQMDLLKKNLTLRFYHLATRRWASPVEWTRRPIRWALRQYRLGEYTFNGAATQLVHRQIGRFTQWVLVRTGMAGVFKYSATTASRSAARAFVRTATRLMIKIGGKALAKITSKAILAIAAAATWIGAVISAITIITMIIDIVRFVYDLGKLAVNFVKQYLHNLDFRKAVNGFVVKVGAIAAFIAGLPLWGTIGIALATTFALATLLAGSLVFSISTVYQVAKNFIPGLDSKATQIFAAVFCDDNPSSTAAPIASCANCLVKYLTECYDQSITASDFTTTGVGCLLARSIAPEVANIIESSATSFNNLQCVGFVQAAALCGGKSLAGQNACGYIGANISGWKYVAGVSGAQPGNLCVVGSSGTCSDSAPGHIFVVAQADCDDLICAIDANNTCAGCVDAEARIPKSDVAGCLVPN